MGFCALQYLVGKGRGFYWAIDHIRVVTHAN